MKTVPPNLHNFTGHVWTRATLNRVTQASVRAVETGTVQSVQCESTRGIKFTAHVAPNGMVTN